MINMFLIKYKRKSYGTKLLFVSHRGIQPPVLESAVSKEQHKKIEEVWTFFFSFVLVLAVFQFYKISNIFVDLHSKMRKAPLNYVVYSYGLEKVLGIQFEAVHLSLLSHSQNGE